MKLLLSCIAVLACASCAPTILLEQVPNEKLQASVEARNDNSHFENITWDISSSKQTDSYIVMDLSIQNNSDRELDFHPLDFYYSHALYFHRIHALDPFYIAHKIKHPFSSEYEPDIPAKNAIITKSGKEFAIKPIIFITVSIVDPEGTVSLENLNYIIRNNRIRKELVKLNTSEVLKPQQISPGEKLNGQLIFPKIYMKKLKEVNIKWRYNEACLGKQFKVL